MTDINLVGINKNSFGKKLPNVFVNRIEVHGYPSGAGSTEVMSGFATATKIKAFLSLKFSKPKFMQGETIKDYLESMGLQLYTCLSFPNYVKRQLEQNKFSLNYWFTRGWFEYAGYAQRFERIDLKDLLTEDASAVGAFGKGKPGTFQKLNVFDNDGDEIVEISNIIVELDYYKPAGTSDHIPELTDVEGLMFFAFVGPMFNILHSSDYVLDVLEGLTIGEDYDMYKPEPYRMRVDELTQNSYYGDVSYVHVLENNEIASKYYDAYITPEGAIYEKPVLQSVNGKIYTTENITFDLIKDRVNAAIEEYKESRSLDADLDKNISNLEAIINADGNRVGVLGEFANYRSTYPDKSPTTMSGQFYNHFVVLFSEIIESVNAETELDVAILYDSLVVDMRTSAFSGVYTRPTPTISIPGTSAFHLDRGVPYVENTLGSPSDSYLARKWFLLSRQAFLSVDIGTLTEEEVRDIYRISKTKTDATTGAELNFADYFTNEFEDVLQDNVREALVQKFIDEGYGAFVAEEVADEYLLDALENLSDGEEMDAIAIFNNLHEMMRTTGFVGSAATNEFRPFLPTLKSGDIKVMNKGMFFFDYEKAVRTQSKISQTLDLTKLQQLFRFTVPYEHFHVNRVELSRNELLIEESPTYTNTGSRFIRPKISLNLSPYVGGSARTYPYNSTVQYGYLGGRDRDSAEDYSYLSERLKYMSPRTGDSPGIYGAGNTSYLAFVNFDFPVANASARLEEYNTLSAAALSGMPLGGDDIGNQVVYDGYKMMAFKFQDIMDDDVALLNTANVDSADRPYDDTSVRSDWIITGNARGERVTCYSTLVEITDRTHMTYVQFSNLIKGYYNEFLSYYKKAAEVCSYNNITNQFNQFFKFSMESEFPDRPWETAAYVAHALNELLSPTAISQDALYELITATMLRISPEEGTLEELNAFAINFEKLVRKILPSLDLSLGTSAAHAAAAEGETTPYSVMYDLSFTKNKKIQFYNEKPIKEPIAGEMINDSTTIESFPDVFVPPTILIPTVPDSLNTLDIPSFKPELIASYHDSELPVGFPESSYGAGGAFGKTGAFMPGGLGPRGDAIGIYPIGGKASAQDVDNYLRLFELVFFPLNLNDPLGVAMMVKQYTTTTTEIEGASGTYERLFAPGEAVEGGIGYDSAAKHFFKPQIDPEDFMFYTTCIGPGRISKVFEYLIDRIFRFTNADNVIFKNYEEEYYITKKDLPTTLTTAGMSGTGTLEGYELELAIAESTENRRQYRKIVPLYHLLKQMNRIVNKDMVIEGMGDREGISFYSPMIIGVEEEGFGELDLEDGYYGYVPLDTSAYPIGYNSGHHGTTIYDNFKHDGILNAMKAIDTNIACYSRRDSATYDSKRVEPSTQSFFKIFTDGADTSYASTSPIDESSKGFVSYHYFINQGLARNAAQMLQTLSHHLWRYVTRASDLADNYGEFLRFDNETTPGGLAHLFNADDPFGNTDGDSYIDPFSESDLFFDRSGGTF